jgi:hypothetical protein
VNGVSVIPLDTLIEKKRYGPFSYSDVIVADC